MIKITKNAFNLEEEFLKIQDNSNGGYSFFLGTVREDIKNKKNKIQSIILECYEKLAVKQLSDIRAQAIKNWNLNNCLIIHRIGKLFLGEKIVLIITASAHRENAIRACEFIIDNLKVNVALWKFNVSNGEEEPVNFKNKDKEKFLKWSEVIKY
jgi:molybdopterin synthase catalytic subunit